MTLSKKQLAASSLAEEKKKEGNLVALAAFPRFAKSVLGAV